MTEPNWLETPAYLYLITRDAGEKAAALRRALLSLPIRTREQVDRLYYHPYQDTAHAMLHGHDKQAWDATEAALAPVCCTVLADGVTPPDWREEPWVLVKAGGAPLKPLAELTNFLPNSANQFFGGPTPLAATLSGGLLGAGLGYAGGTVAEQFLPEKYFEKGRLRKVLALLGGLGGAVPGAAWGAHSMGSNPDHPGLQAWTSGWPVRPKDLAAAEAEKAGSIREAWAALREAQGLEKAAFFGAAGGAGAMQINTDAFNRVVWSDPNTPMDIRAATTGLMESASMLTGGADLVTPLDVGRIAAGMGSGWVSGMLVGKTLGALAGLRPESQEKLQQTGMWAGVLSNVIPMAFRRV